MATLLTHSPANPEFARVLPVANLRRATRFEFDIAPEPTEAAAIARLLDALAVRKLRFAGSLSPAGDGYALDARLGATVVQSCVVTLEPVTTRIDLPVRRRFAPLEADGAATGGAAVELDPAADDELEPLGNRIDLGLVAVEALALALPPYPRVEGAALPQPGDNGDDDGAKPFAALAALRGKPPGES